MVEAHVERSLAQHAAGGHFPAIVLFDLVEARRHHDDVDAVRSVGGQMRRVRKYCERKILDICDLRSHWWRYVERIFIISGISFYLDHLIAAHISVG